MCQGTVVNQALSYLHGRTLEYAYSPFNNDRKGIDLHWKEIVDLVYRADFPYKVYHVYCLLYNACSSCLEISLMLYMCIF